MLLLYGVVNLLGFSRGCVLWDDPMHQDALLRLSSPSRAFDPFCPFLFPVCRNMEHVGSPWLVVVSLLPNGYILFRTDYVSMILDVIQYSAVGGFL